ncbi:hypothetical protein AGABI1DRAFT_96646 [Agaricus bisporus var. burnettii JB137-S8]|uniref:Uncharacterized protein n=1 Tax=Agaricus bisporus var. burnettii (strain JB137-S8 / ATCC MYA-4627 / FGSC 10392) TaxID=597362 RepID=K5W9Y3_AGABU|nr:uncharacterized protein AGABI1DRAFT_96646 [Agaricus bisporus var. burnettii JB137-S8]EKM83664.1 hypothetical protein AGABI1DRAFT_96646 [Agaricus bisporus var. burnettii JB137-S8]
MSFVPERPEGPCVLERRGREVETLGIEMTDSILRADDGAAGFLGIGILGDLAGRLAMLKTLLPRCSKARENQQLATEVCTMRIMVREK